MQETQHTEFKREWRDEWLKKHSMHWDAVGDCTQAEAGQPEQ